MLLSILRNGSQMSGDDGWFGPCATRFNWAWLAARHDLDAKANAISRDQFSGSTTAFGRLDRDGDGKITPIDFDWSDSCRRPQAIIPLVIILLAACETFYGQPRITRHPQKPQLVPRISGHPGGQSSMQANRIMPSRGSFRRLSLPHRRRKRFLP